MANKDFDSLGFVPHGESENDPFAKLGFTTDGKSSPSENEPEKMGKFMSAVTGFNTGAGNFAHGVLQPLTESGVLGDRVKNASKTVAKNRASDYKEAAEANPTSAFLGNMAGGLAASSPLFMIPGVGAAGSIGRAASQGAMQGAATGALSYGSPGERAMGAGIGGGLGAVAYPLAGKLGSANPITKAAAGGTLGAGGAYLATRGNEEGNKTATAIGGLAGAAAPFVPSLASQAFKNFVARTQGKETKGLLAEQYETAAKNHMMGAISPKRAELALKNAGLARKEGLDYITMGEASGSPVVASIEGKLSRTPKGQEEMFERAEGRHDSEVKAINGLLNQISKEGAPAQERVRGAAQEFIKGKKAALQAKAEPHYIMAFESNPGVQIGPVLSHIQGLKKNAAGEMKTALTKVEQMLIHKPETSGASVMIPAVTGEVKNLAGIGYKEEPHKGGLLGMGKGILGMRRPETISRGARRSGPIILNPQYVTNPATGERTVINPKLLKIHNVKMAMDAMIYGKNEVGKNSLHDTTIAMLKRIKNKLLEQMDKVSPDYKKARGIFAEGEGGVEGARVLSAINESEIAKRIANLKDTQLKQVSKNIFDPAQSDTKVIAKLRDRISSVDPQAWNQIVRNELERVMDKKDMSGFAFYKQNLQSDRRFKQMMEATKHLPGVSERLQNMRSIFKNIMAPSSSRTEAGLAKTSMTGEREPIAALKNMMFKMAGSKFDLAQIELTTSPHWDKELAQIAKIKNRQAQASQFSGLLARVGTNMATNITQNNRPSYDD